MEKIKSNKKTIAGYWAATILLVLFLVAGAIGHLFRLEYQAEGMIHLGYPLYFMTILGTWKILGIVAILVPRFALLKEWAYAGIFFNMTGAAVSHAVLQDGFGHIFWPLLIAGLAVASWAMRPPSRKLARAAS